MHVGTRKPRPEPALIERLATEHDLAKSHLKRAEYDLAEAHLERCEAIIETLRNEGVLGEPRRSS